MQPRHWLGLCLLGATTTLLSASRPTRATEPAATSPADAMPARYLRTLAHDPAGYDPTRANAVTDLLLGDLLFHSPHLLGPRAQRAGLTCHLCHPNGAASRTLVLEGVSDRPGNVDLSTAHFNPGADNRIDDFVNIPSLRGVRFTAPYGRDGRTASLSEFIRDVISNEFAGAALPPGYLSALVRYVQDLDFLPNHRLDSRGAVTAAAGARARRGQALFVKPFPGFSGASCATCHVPSSFFRDGRVHRLGSGAGPSPHALEDGFETPTLLGTGETAPYFHDGRFATLAEVTAWFDQTFQLGLGAGGRDDLTAYLEAIGAADRPTDERPRARKMIETFVYLGLLLDGPARDDRAIWRAAIALARTALTQQPPVPILVAPVAELDRRLARLSQATSDNGPLANLRAEVEETRRRLLRLAADWSGALAATSDQAGR